MVAFVATIHAFAPALKPLERKAMDAQPSLSTTRNDDLCSLRGVFSVTPCWIDPRRRRAFACPITQSGEGDVHARGRNHVVTARSAHRSRRVGASPGLGSGETRTRRATERHQSSAAPVGAPRSAVDLPRSRHPGARSIVQAVPGRIDGHPSASSGPRGRRGRARGNTLFSATSRATGNIGTSGKPAGSRPTAHHLTTATATPLISKGGRFPRRISSAASSAGSPTVR